MGTRYKLRGCCLDRYGLNTCSDMQSAARAQAKTDDGMKWVSWGIHGPQLSAAAKADLAISGMSLLAEFA